MSLRNRFFTIVAASACSMLVVTACSEVPTSAAPSSTLAPSAGPSYGYLTPYGCDSASPANCPGVPTTAITTKEQLRVCKWYPAGTVNPPAVQIQLVVQTENPPRFATSQNSANFTLPANSCILIWQNGEDFGPSVDTVWVTEIVPTGYTATSQVSTTVRNGPRESNDFPVTVNAPTTETTVKGYIGGFGKPGMLVEFTNTAIPTTGPGCTLTQGYWKNHEENWPAPYSATAPWMQAGNLVTNTTWDGLMETSSKGGNSYIQLAHQWIAASLNKASGASVPAGVQTTLNLSGAWLLANTPVAGALPVIKDAQATAWAGTLDDYNNGLTGPGHCTD
jgi:hypothetical protein